MFEHNGIKIEVAADGKFCATINGEMVEASSLSAIKKRIDGEKKKADSFVPFTALYMQPGRYGKNEQLVEIKIVGVREDKRRSYGPRVFFKTEPDTACPLTKAMKNTPENRAAQEAVLAHEAESRRIREEREKQLQELRGRVELVNADDYVSK